jgi:hydrogenase maturation protein HypF
MERIRIEVTGTVQGVGFRPFVYKTALSGGIRGFVKNTGNSVEIMAVGKKADIQSFIRALTTEAPPLAKIESIRINRNHVKDYNDFNIIQSDSLGRSGSTLPPDVCICETCLEEINDKGNHRHRYPFTVCVDCGARYSIIEDIPYDRDRTSMNDFPMCPDCKSEYEQPMDRRFHAEPTCCPTCGPRYALYEGPNKLKVDNPIKEAVRELENGLVVAIMGVGGTHLAASLEDEVVKRLRDKFGRRQKPFAIMARDLEAAEEFASIGKLEKGLLSSLRRPIVVLDKKKGVLEAIAPALENIGIMLPYTALHHLMFGYAHEPAFIMTSANLPGEPMFTTPRDVIDSGFSDLSLVHNRRIINRVDDTVIREVDGRPSFIRRSRGYVPEPIQLNGESNEILLGLGAELNVAGCLLKGRRAYLTQYIGDTTKLKTLEFLEETVGRLMKLTGTRKPDRIVIDLHPSYSTRLLGEKMAKDYKAPLVEVQHHFAHAASLMAENKVDEVVCLSLDGAGYGPDGMVWGGEIIYSKDGKMKRFAGLEPQIMPGGDLAAYHPARMLAGILYPHYSSDELNGILSKYAPCVFKLGELEMILKQLERRFNTPLTTSTGRVLDAAAALLGVCYERTFEGEPAMKLEALAIKGKPTIDFPIEFTVIDGRTSLITGLILISALEMIGKQRKSDIAASIQNSIAKGLGKLAVKCASEKGVGAVGVSGGVAYNQAIVKGIREIIVENNLKFITQTQAPPGDGGISLGQCWFTREFRT